MPLLIGLGGGVKSCQPYPLNWPIRIFHLWDGKSPLAWLKAVSKINIFVAKNRQSPRIAIFEITYSVWGPNLLGKGSTVTALTCCILFHTVLYCFLLLAGRPLAPRQLTLPSVYNTPFHLLFLYSTT